MHLFSFVPESLVIRLNSLKRICFQNLVHARFLFFLAAKIHGGDQVVLVKLNYLFYCISCVDFCVNLG